MSFTFPWELITDAPIGILGLLAVLDHLQTLWKRRIRKSALDDRYIIVFAMVIRGPLQ